MSSAGTSTRSLFEANLQAEEHVDYHVKNEEQEVFQDLNELGVQLIELRAQLKATLGELQARRDAAKSSLVALPWHDLVRPGHYALH